MRRILASSGKVIEDDLEKCEKCSLLKQKAIAVCEVCGAPVCEKHAVERDGHWLCVDHAGQEKQEGGLLQKFRRFGF